MVVSASVSVACVILFLSTTSSSSQTVDCSFDRRCQCHSIQQTKQFEADCSELKLERIPAIPNNIGMIDLGRNKIHQIPNQHFNNNSALHQLILSYNVIKLLSTDSFEGLNNVKFLFLDNNHLTTISVDSFAHLTKLQHLNLKNNQNDYTSRTLRLPSSLEVLRIDTIGNLSSVINDSLPELRTLDISGLSGTCEIKTLTNDSFLFLPGLEHLDISSCNIHQVHRGTFRNLSQLTFLDVSFNSCLKFHGVETIIDDLSFTSIQILKIKKLHKLFDMNTMVRKSLFKGLQYTQLRELYVDSNRIQQVEKGAIGMLPKTLRYLSVTDNNFSFGYYLFETLKLTMHFFNLSQLFTTHLPDLEELPSTCESSDNENYTYKFDLNIGHGKLFLNINFSIPKNLTTLILTHSFFRFEVPQFHVGINSLRYIDASSNIFSLWEGPILYLEKLQYLDLSSNLCTNISTVFLMGFPNLRILKGQNNLLGLVLPDDINGDTFRHVPELEELNISYNRIPTLHSNFFKYQTKLEGLFLGGNMLSDIGFRISHMTNLSHLDISNNRFSHLSMEARNALDTKPRLTIDLSGNPFECTCYTINFIKWMNSVKHRLNKLPLYRCKTGEEMSLNDPNRVYQILQKQCSSYTSLIIGTTSMLVVVISIIVSGIVYRYRWRLRYMYYMAKRRYKGNRTTLLQVDEEYEYDVFISYEDSDRFFVHEQMLHQLEDGAGLKLCLHKRDFLPGNEIAENITTAIHNSRKMVVVMSHNYLNSYWCMFEYNMARVESIYSRNKENILFLVFLESIPSNELPLIVLELVQFQSYIEYPNDQHGDVVFWDKLKEVLN